MRVIIAGSRSITNKNVFNNAIKNAIDSGIYINEVISGGARGIDTLAIEYAIDNSILLRVFKAQWGLYNKSAGFIRNKEMADYADALIAIHDGKSKGTQHMIEIATGKDLLVYVETYNKEIA